MLADPTRWSQVQVNQWLQWAVREFSLEGVKMENFHLTGKELCGMGREAFLSRAPPFMGDILWEHLEILQKGNKYGLKAFAAPFAIISSVLQYNRQNGIKQAKESVDFKDL